jgi:hypothetical protein
MMLVDHPDPLFPASASLASGTVEERPDGDISIDSILTALNETDGGAKAPTKPASSGDDIVVSMFQFSLQSSSRVLVSSHFRPILQCNSALSLSFRKTSAGLAFRCDLQDLLVIDRYSKDPPVPYIVSVKSDLSYVQRTHQLADGPGSEPARPTFSLNFERISGKSKVVIAALPIELCLNKECIQMVLSTFARPLNPYAEKVPERVKKSTATKKPDNALTTAEIGIQNLRSVSQRNDDIEVTFEAAAPKIIIPESGEDSGYVLLDCGYLQVKGVLGTAGMSMHMDLTKVSVGMPMTVRDMYKFGEKALYLIKVSGEFFALLFCRLVTTARAYSELCVCVALRYSPARAKHRPKRGQHDAGGRDQARDPR